MQQPWPSSSGVHLTLGLRGQARNDKHRHRELRRGCHRRLHRGAAAAALLAVFALAIAAAAAPTATPTPSTAAVPGPVSASARRGPRAASLADADADHSPVASPGQRADHPVDTLTLGAVPLATVGWHTGRVRGRRLQALPVACNASDVRLADGSCGPCSALDASGRCGTCTQAADAADGAAQCLSCADPAYFVRASLHASAGSTGTDEAAARIGVGALGATPCLPCAPAYESAFAPFAVCAQCDAPPMEDRGRWVPRCDRIHCVAGVGVCGDACGAWTVVVTVTLCAIALLGGGAYVCDARALAAIAATSAAHGLDNGVADASSAAAAAVSKSTVKIAPAPAPAPVAVPAAATVSASASSTSNHEGAARGNAGCADSKGSPSPGTSSPVAQAAHAAARAAASDETAARTATAPPPQARQLAHSGAGAGAGGMVCGRPLAKRPGAWHDDTTLLGQLVRRAARAQPHAGPLPEAGSPGYSAARSVVLGACHAVCSLELVVVAGTFWHLSATAHEACVPLWLHCVTLACFAVPYMVWGHLGVHAGDGIEARWERAFTRLYMWLVTGAFFGPFYFVAWHAATAWRLLAAPRAGPQWMIDREAVRLLSGMLLASAVGNLLFARSGVLDLAPGAVPWSAPVRMVLGVAALVARALLLHAQGALCKPSALLARHNPDSLEVLHRTMSRDGRRIDPRGRDISKSHRSTAAFVSDDIEAAEPSTAPRQGMGALPPAPGTASPKRSMLRPGVAAAAGTLEGSAAGAAASRPLRFVDVRATATSEGEMGSMGARGHAPGSSASPRHLISDDSDAYWETADGADEVEWRLTLEQPPPPATGAASAGAVGAAGAAAGAWCVDGLEIRWKDEDTEVGARALEYTVEYSRDGLRWRPTGVTHDSASDAVRPDKALDVLPGWRGATSHVRVTMRRSSYGHGSGFQAYSVRAYGRPVYIGGPGFSTSPSDSDSADAGMRMRGADAEAEVDGVAELGSLSHTPSGRTWEEALQLPP